MIEWNRRSFYKIEQVVGFWHVTALCSTQPNHALLLSCLTGRADLHCLLCITALLHKIALMWPTSSHSCTVHVLYKEELVRMAVLESESHYYASSSHMLDSR